MSRKELVKALAKRSGKTQSDIDHIFSCFEDMLVDLIRDGESSKLFTGFTLESVRSNGRKHFNLQKNAWEQSSPSIQCKLRTTQNFRERLNMA